MAQDEWRLRIEVDDESAGGLLSRLGSLHTSARELQRELADDRLAVTRDGSTVFVYAGSADQLDRAQHVLDEELAELSVQPELVAREHWLADEERWDDEPPGESVEAEALAAGYAPWEVRIPCRSHHDAQELADALERDGYSVIRRWTYVIAGTRSEDEARALAARLHGEAEPGGELVWEAAPGNPFAIFGGLGGAGTPL